MRRLAVQSRNDEYASRRDYQTVQEQQSLRLVPHDTPSRIILLGDSLDDDDSALIGFGGYIKSSSAISLLLTATAGSVTAEALVPLDTAWQRVGICFESEDADVLEVVLEWDSDDTLDLWGITGGCVVFPEAIEAAGAKGVDDCNKSHLVPETFYFDHGAALALNVDAKSTPHELIDGDRIQLKKCSYCGRLLALDMERLGALSFHKHNAKLTNHQNECRACKKWRINNSFNPLRTTDQLHESSVITRERKLFLREPEILQSIKERTGAGLKSQVWERFGRKCFYCDTPLELKEVQLDHTRPLAYLWPIDEHATCLCATHNNEKKEKFPVDFYTDEQLRALADICGLPYAELREKRLNDAELDRILADITRFALEWEPRTFAATARKVAELRPDIDLFEALRGADAGLHEALTADLANRPDPVE